MEGMIKNTECRDVEHRPQTKRTGEQFRGRKLLAGEGHGERRRRGLWPFQRTRLAAFLHTCILRDSSGSQGPKVPRKCDRDSH